MTGEAAGPRRRDAAQTRELLLAAARQRFAYAGYAATTVREISDDAGVNVALINRYFGSKEGLFEACLTKVRDDTTSAPRASDAADIAAAIARELTARRGPGPLPSDLLLLLRSSGDPAAEQIRLGTLRASAERIVGLGGHDGDDDAALLRAQVVLCLGMGLAVASTWGDGFAPLATASEAQLTAALTPVVTALLT